MGIPYSRPKSVARRTSLAARAVAKPGSKFPLNRNLGNFSVRDMRLVNPRGTDLSSGEFHLNDRPSELSGKTLGLLENHKANSDKVLQELAVILKEKYDLKDVIMLSKHSASLPTKPEVVQELMDKVDVLITGIGD